MLALVWVSLVPLFARQSPREAALIAISVLPTCSPSWTRTRRPVWPLLPRASSSVSPPPPPPPLFCRLFSRSGPGPCRASCRRRLWLVASQRGAGCRGARRAGGTRSVRVGRHGLGQDGGLCSAGGGATAAARGPGRGRGASAGAGADERAGGAVRRGVWRADQRHASDASTVRGGDGDQGAGGGAEREAGHCGGHAGETGGPAAERARLWAGRRGDAGAGRGGQVAGHGVHGPDQGAGETLSSQETDASLLRHHDRECQPAGSPLSPATRPHRHCFSRQSGVGPSTGVCSRALRSGRPSARHGPLSAGGSSARQAHHCLCGQKKDGASSSSADCSGGPLVQRAPGRHVAARSSAGHGRVSQRRRAGAGGDRRGLARTGHGGGRGAQCGHAADGQGLCAQGGKNGASGQDGHVGLAGEGAGQESGEEHRQGGHQRRVAAQDPQRASSLLGPTRLRRGKGSWSSW